MIQDSRILKCICPLGISTDHATELFRRSGFSKRLVDVQVQFALALLVFCVLAACAACAVIYSEQRLVDQVRLVCAVILSFLFIALMTTAWYAIRKKNMEKELVKHCKAFIRFLPTLADIATDDWERALKEKIGLRTDEVQQASNQPSRFRPEVTAEIVTMTLEVEHRPVWDMMDYFGFKYKTKSEAV